MPTRPVRPLVLAAVLALGFVSAVPAQAQVRGMVRDAFTGQPLEGVLVRADSTGTVELTDDDGTFAIRRGLESGVQTLTFQLMGWTTVTLQVELPVDEPLEVTMSPAPLEIEGFDVRANRFESRYAETTRTMDGRLARLPGRARVATAEMLRPYDDTYQADPWLYLARLLKVTWHHNDDMVRNYWIERGVVRPEVYIDDRRTWLFRLTRTPTAELCRVEFYVPTTPAWGPGTQLRAYTCAFMADVANGVRELRENINWGDLIAGPWEDP